MVSKCTKNGWNINKRTTNSNDLTPINKKVNSFWDITFMEIIGKKFVSSSKIEPLRKFITSFIIVSTQKLLEDDGLQDKA